MKKKHWLKSFVAAVTASALVWTCAPVGALAAGPDTGAAPAGTAASARTATLPAQGNGWYLDADGTLTIENDEGMKDWCNRSFTYHLDVKSVVLQNGVTTIGDWAFEDCSELTSVTISNSVISIGDSAFAGCNSLTSVIIPRNIKYIGIAAFSCCTNLTNINIPYGVTSISNFMFSECVNLKNIKIPNSVKSIGISSFNGCISLKSISIPKSVKTIGAYALNNCKSLTDIYYSGTKAQWDEIEKCNDYGDTDKILANVKIHYS